MIFASDLDRTLIFSDIYLKECPPTGYEIFEMATVDESNVCSYMSKETAEVLRNLILSNNLTFIPVTTRSIKEYTRIDWDQAADNLSNLVKYAIVSNGGHILYKGQILNEYEEYIRKQLNITEMSEIADILNNKLEMTREAGLLDDSFLFGKTSDTSRFRALAKQLKSKYKQYEFMSHRSKIYCIPSCLNKGTAIKWLSTYLKDTIDFVSGDSSFDIPLLEFGKYVFIPAKNQFSTNELRKVIDNGCIVTGQGIKGSEDTLRYIRDVIYRLELEKLKR